MFQVQYAPPISDQLFQPSAGIDWSSCGQFDPQYSIADAQNITCGYYEVPLDYTDETAGNAKLAVVKYPASGERVGTLLVNPGLSSSLRV